jgi:GT2 family glycosyltransferase
MHSSPFISVIIPARNAGQTIAACLEALSHQTYPVELIEIIVVDDGSTDGTCSVVASFHSVRLISQDPAGPAAARNRGVAHAQGEIALFTDADCAPLPDWIEEMIAPLVHGEAIGTKGAYLTRQSSLVARFVQAEYEDKYTRMARFPSIDFVDTYAAAYRRDIFQANGGFDLAFPTASVEDQEFSFRMARQGYKMVFVPDARVYHARHAADLITYFRKKFHIGYWKVQVHKRHPEKLLSDAHTPQILKLQILLVALGGLSALAGLSVFLAGGPGTIFFHFLAYIGIAFTLTTLPFVFRTWRSDRSVALVSPGLLFTRALALGLGFASGLLVTVSGKQVTSPAPLTSRKP